MTIFVFSVILSHSVFWHLSWWCAPTHTNEAFLFHYYLLIFYISAFCPSCLEIPSLWVFINFLTSLGILKETHIQRFRSYTVQLGYHLRMFIFQFHPLTCKFSNFILLSNWIIFCCVKILHFYYPLISWIFQLLLFPCLWIEHEWAGISVIEFGILLPSEKKKRCYTHSKNRNLLPCFSRIRSFKSRVSIKQRFSLTRWIAKGDGQRGAGINNC